jgi:hypothetical protein
MFSSIIKMFVSLQIEPSLQPEHLEVSHLYIAKITEAPKLILVVLHILVSYM